MNNFRKLNVWKKAVYLAPEVYKKTSKFPKDERFGLISQMRRCSVSIASNIAEGAGRESKKDFNHFLNVSVGSAYELETQLLISRNLNYLNQATHGELDNSVVEIRKMLYSLKKTLK